MKTALILYEPEQLAFLPGLMEHYTQDGVAPDLLSLDAEIDYELEKLSLPFTSGATLHDTKEPQSYLRAAEIANTMFDAPLVKEFSFKSVPLMEPLRFSIHIYFILFLRHVGLVARYLDSAPHIQRIVVQRPMGRALPTAGTLAEHELFAVVEAARRTAESRGVLFESPQGASAAWRAQAKIQGVIFGVKRSLFGFVIQLLSSAMSLRRRRAIRIVASDYWRNIAPIMHELKDEAELVLIDRTEALKAGIKTIWRHKIMFVHIDHFLTRALRAEATAYAKQCEVAWDTAGERAWDGKDLSFCKVDLAPLCRDLMSTLVERALPNVARDIAGAHRLFDAYAPDAVEVRASISAQTHFAILSRVARMRGIPTLEPQHGAQYVGPGSPTLDHAAEYIAAYGPLYCREFESVGTEAYRLLPAGSPRFDAYMKNAQPVSEMHEHTVYLSIAPPVDSGEGFGTYSTPLYYNALGKALGGVPGSELLISLRSASVRSMLSQEAIKRGLGNVKPEIVGGPLPALFVRSDVVLCNYSTVIYEAMLYNKPVVIVALTPTERMMAEFHFGPFEQAGALAIARSEQELADVLKRLGESREVREAMGAAAKTFMEQNFSFDGKSSQRIADQIRAWAKK